MTLKSENVLKLFLQATSIYLFSIFVPINKRLDCCLLASGKTVPDAAPWANP